MRRAGALLLAVAMVVAAFVVRDRTTGEAGGASGDDGAELLCPTEFGDICRAVSDDVRIEPAGATADRLLDTDRSGDLGARAWIVPAAWARTVVGEAARLGLERHFEFSGPLASSPVVLAIWEAEASALSGGCGGNIDWTCLVNASAREQTGFRVRLGGPPVDTSTGLTVAASQAADLLDGNDFGSQDFDARLRQLVAPIAKGALSDPIGALRIQGPGLRTAVGVASADVTGLSAAQGTLELRPSDPPARVDVVAVTPASDQLGESHRAAIAAAFRAAGWDAPADGPDGLPADGSVLAAVRTLWKENQP